MSKDLIKLCIDTANNKVQTYSQDQGSEMIRKAFIELMGTATPDARTLRRNAQEVFAILEEVLEIVIVDGWRNNPFFQQFVETKNIPEGDQNSFYVPDRTMLVISEISRGNWSLRRQRLDKGQNFSVPTKAYGAKVYEEFRRFIAGRIDWPALVAKIRQALDHQIASQIYATFVSSGDYLPSAFTATGSYDQGTLGEIIAHVRAANNNAGVTIAGTLNALSNIVDGYSTTWISEEMKEQHNRSGMIQNWRGYPLFEIPQIHAPNTFDFVVTDDILMVLPGDVKPVKFVFEGQSMIKETADPTTNEDMTIEHTFLTSFGVAVIFNRYYGVYDIAAS